MPYNTRRKSLSLPALGIQLPQTARARRESVSKPPAAAGVEPSAAAAAAAAAGDSPPAKRAKHSHGGAPLPTASPIDPPPPLTAPPKTVAFADRPRSGGRTGLHTHTPPRSPTPTESRRIDVAGINDDIVVGVIEQLETTGNRPHLLKELATVLSSTNNSVANSANPAALLSSRLMAYMRRPWTALAPCPIAKELVPVHPRRVFYFLTTQPRQPVPIMAAEALKSGQNDAKRIISPSLSNASQEDDETIAEDRKRAALSPSPELELSLDMEEAVPPTEEDKVMDFPTPGSNLGHSRSNTDSSMHAQPLPTDVGVNRRTLAPMEGDEREFADTAHYMLLRDYVNAGKEGDWPSTKSASTSDGSEHNTRRNVEIACLLFGEDAAHRLHYRQPGSSESSDSLKALQADTSAAGSPKRQPKWKSMADVGHLSGTATPAEEQLIGEPEAMDLDELDASFEGY